MEARLPDKFETTRKLIAEAINEAAVLTGKNKREVGEESCLIPW